MSVVGLLPSGCGASCLLNGASCLLIVGRVFFGASCLGASCLWGKLSVILMYVIVTCKYEMDLIKNSREKVATLFSHYKSMGIFSDTANSETVV